MATATFSNDSIVLLTTVDNPKRPGTAAYEAFKKYANCVTVAECLAAGVRRSALAWDSARGFIVVVQDTPSTKAAV